MLKLALYYITNTCFCGMTIIISVTGDQRRRESEQAKICVKKNRIYFFRRRISVVGQFPDTQITRVSDQLCKAYGHNHRICHEIPPALLSVVYVPLQSPHDTGVPMVRTWVVQSNPTVVLTNHPHRNQEEQVIKDVALLVAVPCSVHIRRVLTTKNFTARLSSFGVLKSHVHDDTSNPSREMSISACCW